METKNCEVYLVSAGQQIINAIKIVRQYTTLGLKEAKDLVESAPGVVCSGVTRDVAEDMKRDFEAIGARVEIRDESGTGRDSKDSGWGSEYEVFLSDPGSEKIEVIKVVRQYTTLGLKEAKDLVESAPGVVCTGVSQEAAWNMKRDLENAGALAEVTGGSGFGWTTKDSDDASVCEVFLSEAGPEKIEVIKIVRNYTALGLKEAKDLVESAPGVVCSGVTRDVAEDMKRDLENVGATAQIRNY